MTSYLKPVPGDTRYLVGIQQGKLHIEQFDVGQSYVTAKVENRYGDIVKINIEGGRLGIELQETLFKIKGKQQRLPRLAYIMTTINDTGKILVRKFHVIGVKD